MQNALFKSRWTWYPQRFMTRSFGLWCVSFPSGEYFVAPDLLDIQYHSPLFLRNIRLISFKSPAIANFWTFRPFPRFESILPFLSFLIPICLSAAFCGIGSSEYTIFPIDSISWAIRFAMYLLSSTFLRCNSLSSFFNEKYFLLLYNFKPHPLI